MSFRLVLKSLTLNSVMIDCVISTNLVNLHSHSEALARALNLLNKSRFLWHIDIFILFELSKLVGGV